MATLTAPDGTVRLHTAPRGHLVTLHPNRPHQYLPVTSCETTLPPALVERFLALSFTDLCDSLSRHEGDVGALVERQLAAYWTPTIGARILDFGCGTGASTVHLARLFPDAVVVGVELDPAFVGIAGDVLRARGVSNARVLQSPDANSLPSGIGPFDVIVLSAVYEHLLPDERRTVLPLLWSVLKPGGILCVSQTPHRWFPYEHHSTGLWFINYLPDRAAHWLAKHCARMYPEENRARTWTAHLRGGLRGGTERAVLRGLAGARVMQPKHGSRASYWLAQTSPRHRRAKRLMAAFFAVTDRLFGSVPSMNLDVVIQRPRTPSRTP